MVSLMAAAAAIVSDNSFESYQVNDYSYSATSAYWGTYLGVQSGSSTWGGTTAADGNMYLALQPGNARIASQSISLFNLYSYKLSLYASSRTNGQSCTAPLSVSIGSTLVLYVTQPPLSTTMQYYSTTFTYSGQSAATTLTLENSVAGNVDCTIFVDDIVLTLIGKYYCKCILLNAECFHIILLQRQHRRQHQLTYLRHPLLYNQTLPISPP